MPDQKAKTAELYNEMQVQTSGLKSLVCLMHRKTLSLIRKGIEEGSRRDIEKAQNLIFQLELALDRNEKTSELLAELYAYCYYLLESGNTHSIIVARKILETLGGAFGALAKGALTKK
jgi:flagellin-specific chaperone FliS